MVYNEEKIYSLKNQVSVSSINLYLVNAPKILIQNRSNPINDVPKIYFGNMPNDGDNLILNQQEKEKIIKDNPLSKKWIRKFVGAEEFLNSKKILFMVCWCKSK